MPVPQAPISQAALDSAKTSNEPERVSPQALRESILVLQEQLQERETRIESLQGQINSLDTTAPAKLKERDTEITWLRELLAVRNEDLSELIRQLEKDGFDREAVRDYAIRIRAGIQMEQAEKERLISAGTSKAAQAVAGLVNVASPGAARLASAWGNWRKGRTESSSSSRAAAPAPASSAPSASRTSRALGKAPSSAPILRAQSQALRPRSTDRRAATPSKPNAPSALSSSGIFAGLMTPPASNLRRTPSPDPSSSSAAMGAAPMEVEMSGTMMPQYQQGTVNPAFTQAPPPGFGPRKSSPLSQTDDSAPGLFGGSGYDSDAEVGPVPEGSLGGDDDVLGGGDEDDDDDDLLNEADVGRGVLGAVSPKAGEDEDEEEKKREEEVEVKAEAQQDHHQDQHRQDQHQHRHQQQEQQVKAEEEEDKDSQEGPSASGDNYTYNNGINGSSGYEIERHGQQQDNMNGRPGDEDGDEDDDEDDDDDDGNSMCMNMAEETLGRSLAAELENL
ncbi:hypothetical protein AAFC00_005526 [Neodothiora populina]